uniref:Uncharacterized protein n=1 Tax=Rhipicephalus pulchellus TaxID=72859 RepID=L7M245_RHIPC
MLLVSPLLFFSRLPAPICFLLPDYLFRTRFLFPCLFFPVFLISLFLVFFLVFFFCRYRFLSFSYPCFLVSVFPASVFFFFFPEFKYILHIPVFSFPVYPLPVSQFAQFHEPLFFVVVFFVAFLGPMFSFSRSVSLLLFATFAFNFASGRVY